MARNAAVFRKAIVDKVGTDPDAIETALRENLVVQISEDPHDSKVDATSRQCPFVFHVACDDCLSDTNSRTASLDETYGSLAEKVDRALHRALIEMARLEVSIGTVVREAEKRGLKPSQLEPEVNAQLQGLLRESEKVFALALAP